MGGNKNLIIMKIEHIPEAFFHFLWKNRRFQPEIHTIEGQHVSILDPGRHNHDAGPDFLCARIRIGKTLWAGNVEIHVRASDWYRHQHQEDPNYASLILHVVAINDRPVYDQKGKPIQTLCIGDAFDKGLLERYREISQNLLWVPCMNMIRKVSSVHITSMVHRMAVERLEEKSSLIMKDLETNHMDWDEVCYRMLGKQFGGKINAVHFDMLCRSLPVRVLMKYHGQVFQTEALLFGQSGLLNTRLYGPYPNRLKKEYTFLANKHGLSPMPGYLWKFLRLRPAAFPTLRIAQMAELYARHQRLFRKIMETPSTDEMIGIFKVEASLYWDTHYLFGRKGRKNKKRLGTQSIQLLLINAIIPLMYLYAKHMGNEELRQRAIGFLEQLPPEKNAVMRRWSECGVQPVNALETQGLLQLKKKYCDEKRCLECKIGLQLLKQPQ